MIFSSSSRGIIPDNQECQPPLFKAAREEGGGEEESWRAGAKPFLSFNFIRCTFDINE
jgi:hypothetical protein